MSDGGEPYVVYHNKWFMMKKIAIFPTGPNEKIKIKCLLHCYLTFNY